MIPRFPEFKRLELSDQADIEKFTSKFDPYSDFNFVDMWSWNLKDSMEVSELNGNLIIQPNDYFTNDYSLSYLGSNELGDTLEKLFAYMVLEEVPEPQLKFVPEVSLSGIDLSKYFIEIDIDNCDYVYNLEKMHKYEGSEYADKRRKINGFLKNHSHPEIRQMDLFQDDLVTEITSLLQKWTEIRSNGKSGNFTNGEDRAIARIISAKFKTVKCCSVYDAGELLGFMIYSEADNKFSICHFAKANTEHFGVYEYLMKELSGRLLLEGKALLNYQEDLGITGLRFFKSSFNPVSFLRKYTIKQR